MSLYLRSSLAALSQGDRKCMSFLDESHKVLKGIHVLCHYNISYVIGQQFIPNRDINRHVLRGFPIDLSMLFYSVGREMIRSWDICWFSFYSSLASYSG